MNKKKKMPIELAQVYVKYYIPLIVGFSLKFAKLIPDTKLVQGLLLISVIYAVLGSFNILITNRKFQESTFKIPNVLDYELTLLAKRLTNYYEVQKSNPTNINEMLIETFKGFQLKKLRSNDPLHDKYLSPLGEVYDFSMEKTQKLLVGDYITDFGCPDKHYRLDFNFETIIPYMKKFILLYRDMIENGFVSDDNKGFICFRDFIIGWLIDRCFLTDALLEDEEIYVRKEV